MKIGVASQNRRSVTAHAGRCRRFRVYDIDDGKAGPGELLELGREGTLHALRPAIPPALAELDVIIAADLCDNLLRRLARHGIEGWASDSEQPDDAVQAFLAKRGQPA